MAEPQNIPVFNPADYPRHYAYETPLLDWAVGFLFVFGCFFAGTYVLAYDRFQSTLPENYIVFSFVGLLTATLIAVLMVHRTEVEMDADEIRVRKRFKQRILRRSDIKGWHYCRKWTEDGDFISLVSLRPADRAIYIKKDNLENLKVDNAFHAWYQSLPDLGRSKKDAYYEAIAKTESLGRTREERISNMALAARILNGFRYFFITAFVAALLLPNAYLPRLTDSAFTILAILTSFGIAIIYKYPVLLIEPPVGIGRKTYSPFLIVSGWGAILYLWFWRDIGTHNVMPDFLEMSLNSYMVGIFLMLFAPLLADGNWKQMPRRILWDTWVILMAACAFYFSGNMALDRAQPTIKVESYEVRPFQDPESKVTYMFVDKDGDSGKMIDGCSFRYPGAFGTPWERNGPCPENFQKTEAEK